MRNRNTIDRLALAGALLATLGVATAACGQVTSNGGEPSVSPVMASSDPAPTRTWALDLPLRTWVSREAPAVGAGPLANGSGKHSRLLFDSKRNRMVLTGGDYSYAENGWENEGDRSGIHIVWAIDLSKGEEATWTRLTSWCAQPGGIQPGRPDTVVWAYDSMRDQGVMMGGFYFITQKSHANRTKCPGVEQVIDSVLFDFGTSIWKLPPYGPPPKGYGGDTGASYGVYDPVTDAVYRFRNRDDGIMEVLYRKTNSWEQNPLGIPRTSPNRDQSAIDVKGRNIYAISWRMGALMRYSISAKRVVETVEMPPKWAPPGPSIESWLVFDPINRVVLIPVSKSRSFDGVLHGLAIYHVDQKRWEWEEPPTTGFQVSGNTLGFDPVNNCLILLGRNKDRRWWLYRYGNGVAGGGTSKRSDRPSRRAGDDIILAAATDQAPAVAGGSRPPRDPAAGARLEGMPENGWLRLKPKPRIAYQPAVSAKNSAAPDLRDRPITIADPIARSYSGLAYGGGVVFNFGGGHATHPGNDVDLYVVDANQWAVQYPPESPVNGSGEARTIAGAGSSVPAITPLGRPYTEHTYQQTAYDSRRKRFMSVLRSGTWEWDPATTKWRLLAGPALGTLSPGWHTGRGNVVYDAGADALIAFVTGPRKGSERGVYRLSGDSTTWSHVGSFPSRKEYSYKELYSAYNPDRREIAVVVESSRLFRYRLDGNAWTEVTSFPDALKGGFPNFAYDSRNKAMVFLVTPRGGDDEGDADRKTQIWAWDPARDTWSNPPTPDGAPEPLGSLGKERGSFVYDPNHNVFIHLRTLVRYCDAGGYACGGTTESWAYRYRR